MLHYAYNAYLVKIKVHKLSKKLGVTSQFLEPEDWYEAKSMLRIHKLRATLQNPVATAIWRPGFVQPRVETRMLMSGLQNPVATAIWRPGFVQPRVETRMLMSGRILNTCSQKNSDLKSHYTWVSKK